MDQPAQAPPPPAPPAPAAPQSPWPQRLQRLRVASVRGYHAYGNWLISITWWRFIAYSLLLLITMGIVHDKPPFTWKITQQVESTAPRVVVVPRAPAPPAPPAPPATGVDTPVRIVTPKKGEGVDISIGKDGIHITPRPAPGTASASGASAPSGAASDASPQASADLSTGVQIALPPGSDAAAVREAVATAKREIEEALKEAREEAAQAAREAVDAKHEAEQALEELTREPQTRVRITRVGIGDVMMQLTTLFLLASGVLKGTYKGRVQAERQAARAAETAESESLKRQVVEARMAAMQAQVEPHFLFNTLASIDHLIETDPPRASQMQKNLIALLRASMPTMREASSNGAQGVRDLGRELAVIRPYLEILKVRMEERLTTRIDVPEGLHSAEFPPMMIQTLVENAIKHGLEPKAEGGTLEVKAQIVHGKLQVTVADTGLGFGRAATAGTGVGLANIRERLQLLYGPKAALTVAENQPCGTLVTVTVPYKTVEEAMA